MDADRPHRPSLEQLTLPMGDRLVLDLETQFSFEDVGGRDRLAALKVSVLGLYSYAADQFRIHHEPELSGLAPLLGSADLIIGFNIRRFDYPVLAPYVSLQLERLPTLDLMDEVTHALGHRLSLDHLAEATLGEKKQGHGLDAIRFFRAGEMDKLTAYCLHDVKLTRDLYEFGTRHGVLYYREAGERRQFPVRWGTAAR